LVVGCRETFLLSRGGQTIVRISMTMRPGLARIITAPGPTPDLVRRSHSNRTDPTSGLRSKGSGAYTGYEQIEFSISNRDRVLRRRVGAGIDVRDELAKGRDPLLLETRKLGREVAVRFRVARL